MSHQGHFRTIVTVPDAEHKIEISSGVFLIGSCFSDNIGEYLTETRFPALVNPFGVLYNPLSIKHAFYNILENRVTTTNNLFHLNDLWHSFQHHGKFSHPDASIATANINKSTLDAHSFLKKAEFIIITFGTAFVYYHKELQQVVANCHKFPHDNFTRKLITTEEIVNEWEKLITKLRAFNPKVKLIFTVSPVRHWKDSAHGNQISKSILLLAIEKLKLQFENIWYFPAYEILLDELRDYRFYKTDMLHPNETALNYIWKRFSESTLSDEARHYYKEAKKIQLARQHKLIGHPSSSFKQFVQQTIENINRLSDQYPSSLIKKDKEYFEKLFLTK